MAFLCWAVYGWRHQCGFLSVLVGGGVFRPVVSEWTGSRSRMATMCKNTTQGMESMDLHCTLKYIFTQN